nr:glycoside hydrolase family 43 protein [Streptomyces zhaozhouensis]
MRTREPLMRARSRKNLVVVVLALLVGLAWGPQATAGDSMPQDPPPTTETTTDEAAPAASGTFRNPLNPGPDPFLTYANGEYHLATTQGDGIRMWSASSLADLLAADPVTVWTDTDPSRDQHIWAPEFYRFGDRWYMYYTADDGVDEHHRLFVLESEGDDPRGPYHFKAKLEPPNHVDKFAIDPGILQHDGKLYLAYSGLNEYQHNGLNIAPMSNPYTVSGDAVPFDAAGGCPEVREGPAFLYRNGKTWMTYSACDTGKPDYQVWMMSLPEGADPLVRENWTQHDGALFSRNDEVGVYGPGHHTFFTSPDGTEDWIIYHAKNTSENTYTHRTTRAQPISWNDDGSPNLGRPLALGATLDLPSGDPGSGNYWINDDGRSSGDGTVTFEGNWNSGSGCATQCFWSDDHWSDEPGATATFTFTGTRIALLSVEDTGNGIAAISVDGGPEERVDFHGPIRTGETVHYLSPRLPEGEHTLTVRVTGEHNPDSGGAFVSVDRAEVYTD